jgi:hypothetical protein
LASLQNIINYYTDLLIIQYKTKPKAIAQISLFIEQLFSHLLYFQVERAFDIDTAIGKQLDILAKYVGCNRTISNYIIERNYFELNPPEIINPIYNGFGKLGLLFYGLGSELNETSIYTMNDFELRTMIRFLIIKNNTTATFYSILNNLYNFFGSDILLTDNMDMTWTITINQNYSNLIQICLSQDYFPRPQGVKLILVIN